MECTCQLHDSTLCHCANDSVANCVVQEEMLQGHPRLAYSLLTDAAVSILIFVHRVSN